MADDCIQVVAMADSGGESEVKYEIFEAASDMFCVIGLDKGPSSTRTPGAKPKYKQAYREAWESMKDFKGWLSSVPGNTSKAYCKLCQKELHCHRLSLLKHKVTYKHQKKEEDQKMKKLRANKNESCLKKLKDIKAESIEGSYSNNESVVIKMEGDKSDADKSVILPKATTSETCRSLLQEDEGEVEPKSGTLSTHILDISRGLPGALVHLVLYKLIDGRWTLIKEGLTNLEGRHHFFDPDSNEFSEGRYKLHFDVDKYFEQQSQETIFPFIEVVFDVKDMGTPYHIPLLLSPYGYSTYRGS